MKYIQTVSYWVLVVAFALCVVVVVPILWMMFITLKKLADAIDKLKN